MSTLFSFVLNVVDKFLYPDPILPTHSPHSNSPSSPTASSTIREMFAFPIDVDKGVKTVVITIKSGSAFDHKN